MSTRNKKSVMEKKNLFKECLFTLGCTHFSVPSSLFGTFNAVRKTAVSKEEPVANLSLLYRGNEFILGGA